MENFSKKESRMLEKKLKHNDNIATSFIFYVLALILGAVFFLFFLSDFKYYKTSTSILVAPRAGINADAMLNNLTKLPKTLSFYEKIISENKLLRDNFSGLEKDEKKAMWNRMIKTRIDNSSSIINIDIYAKNRLQSLLFSQQTARTLLGTASFYYDIRKDVDFRVVEEPQTRGVIMNWPWLIASSVLFGLAFSYFLNALRLKIISKAIKVKTVDKKQPVIPQTIASKKLFQPLKQSKENKQETPTKKGMAPENLPIFFGYHGQEDEKKESKSEGQVESGKEREPTEEELKRRLNQLLRGDL